MVQRTTFIYIHELQRLTYIPNNSTATTIAFVYDNDNANASIFNCLLTLATMCDSIHIEQILIVSPRMATTIFHSCGWFCAQLSFIYTSFRGSLTYAKLTVLLMATTAQPQQQLQSMTMTMPMHLYSIAFLPWLPCVTQYIQNKS